MLKSYQYSLSLLQKALDLLAFLFSWYLAYTIRFHFIPGGQQGLGKTLLKISIVLAIISLYCFQKIGLYKSQRFNTLSNELFAILKANSLSFITFVIVLYFFYPNKVSRIMLLHYFLISFFLLTIMRISIRNFLRFLRKQGKNLRHILLVGNGEQACQYVEMAFRFKDAGLSIIGWIDSEGLSTQYKIPSLEMNLEQAKQHYYPDCIVIGYKGEKSQVVNEILKKSYNDIVPIQVLPDLSYAFIGHQISDFGGLPIISFNQPKITPLDSFFKRSFDLVLSFIGLLILSPLLLIISFLVKITSKGPIFYGQERMGLDGQCFVMWKFRSMKVDAEVQSGAMWCIENDPRRTIIGKFLRESSLDELPQLWNVFTGEMSLVGPRPERPVFVEKFRSEIPVYMLRHKMKAGITGWAQINGWRGNTSLERRIECDIYYIKNWSLWMDIKILFMTVWKGFFNKNAY